MMGLVSNYIRKRWGCHTNWVENFVAVILANSNVAAQNNPNRFSIMFQNMGANIVYISVASGVGPLAGIQLAANGGLISFNVEDDGEITTRQWYSIGAGASTLYVGETIGL